jgi:Domain of Unknown Function (DUF1080)
VRLRFVHLLFLASLCLAQPPNQLSPEEKSAAWTLLFDGATTNGWTEVSGLPFPASWKIDDGCLKAIPNPQDMQDIRTADKFNSFDLQFEWKLAKGGNSGVKYLVQKTDRWQRRNETGWQARARGLEYQIVDDNNNEDALSASTRVTASLYSYIAPSKRLQVEMNVFHKSRILRNGNHVEHWLDGEKVLQFELTNPTVQAALRSIGKSETAALESFISLQNHNSEVWFRNIKIRRLD